MRRVLLSIILIIGMTAAQGFAQMGQGHMSGEGHMGQEQGMMGSPGFGENKDSRSSQYPMMGQGGQGMMGSRMMGYGQGFGECGMRGQSHMGGYGMTGGGHMGSMMGGYGHMRGGHMGYGGNDAAEPSPEAYEKYQKEYQKYMDDTAGLRKKIHNKKFDYYEAARNPDTTRKTLLKIEKEIRDLQWEMYEKAPQ